MPVDYIAWKQLLDENKNKLAEILTECQNGSAEQVLLQDKMSSLLADFTEVEEQLFAGTLDSNDQAANQDET